MDKIFYNHCSELWHHIEIFIKHMKKCVSQKLKSAKKFFLYF